MLCPCFWVVLSQGYIKAARSNGVLVDGCLALEGSDPARGQVDPEAIVMDATVALIAPVGDSGVLLELLVGSGLSHGCLGEEGRNRSRLLDFVALNIYPRPEPGQAKVTTLNINCTYQFPMNDQPEVVSSMS